MKMNCNQLDAILDDLLDQRLNRGTEQDAMAHINSCEECHHYYHQSYQLQQTLYDLPKHRPDSQFVTDAIARAEQQNSRLLNQTWRTWLTGMGAVAAALTIWVQLGIHIPTSKQQTALPQVQISLNQTQNVNLTVKTSHTMNSVKFTVRMPEGVDLAGMPGNRDIQWEGSLRSGDNLLSLPVIAHQRPSGDLEAWVTHAGKSKVYRVRLILDTPPQSI